MDTFARLSPQSGDILLTVGTVKGAFIFLKRSDARRFQDVRPSFSRTIGRVGRLHGQRCAANHRRQQKRALGCDGQPVRRFRRDLERTRRGQYQVSDR